MRLIRLHPFWLIAFLGILTRVPFIDGSIDFFDSPQYLWRSVLPNIVDALSTGHAPYHPGYVGIVWLSIRLFGGVLSDPMITSLVNALASIVSLWFVFLIAERLVDRRSAWLTTLFVAVAPYFWVSSITILVDQFMITCWLGSLWLYLRFLTEPQGPRWLVLASGIAMGASLVVHTQIALWSLAFPALIIALVPAKRWVDIGVRSLPWLLGPILAAFIYAGLLVHSEHNPTALSALHYLVTGNASDRGPLSLVDTWRNLRLVASSSLLIAGLVGWLALLRHRLALGVGIGLWLWPATILSSSYVYSNLTGRTTMLAIIPLALAASWLVLHGNWLARWRTQLTGIILFSVIVSSLPLVIDYGRFPGAMEGLDRLRTRLPSGGVYVSSNATATLHSYEPFDVVPDVGQPTIEADIERSLTGGNRAFVGSDALTYPFFVVDGLHLRIFSPPLRTPTDHGSLTSYMFDRYALTLHSALSYRPLGIFELARPGQPAEMRIRQTLEALPIGSSALLARVSSGEGEPVAHLQLNPIGRPGLYPVRIDASDWLTQLGHWLSRILGHQQPDPLSFSYTDVEGMGVVLLPDGSHVENVLLVHNALRTAQNQSRPPLFVNADVVSTVRLPEQEERLTLLEATERLSGQPTVFTQIERLDEEHVTVRSLATAYELPATGRVEAAMLPSEIGENRPDGSRRIQGGATGFASYGPWRDLPAGSYTATWKLERLEDGNKDEVVELEVVGALGVAPLGRRIVTETELPEGVMTDHSISFEVGTEDRQLEFRTRALGGPSFSVESITIAPDS